MTAERSASLAALLVLASGAGCAARPAPAREAAKLCAPNESADAGEQITLRCAAPGLWIFTAIGTVSSGTYPGNGLLVESRGGSLLVDTGWTRAQGEALLAFAQARGLPVSAAVVTHFHSDRLGGAQALRDRGLPIFASSQTIALARSHGGPQPDRELRDGEQPLPGLRWLHPGAGHSRDNIVVFHEQSGTLFGGCFVKEDSAKDLGNIADADLASWPASIQRTLAAFPAATRVVPGHGDPGGLELLRHTLALLRGAP